MVSKTRTRRTLATLVRDVRACALCADQLPLGPRPILQLSASSRILIAGQALGGRVHETGVPFHDPSGNRLREWLAVSAATFYDPRAFAILPMGFCFPGTGRSGDLLPRAECAPAWREALLSNLDKLAFTNVLGRYALAYHLPDATTLTAAVAALGGHCAAHDRAAASVPPATEVGSSATRGSTIRCCPS